MFKDDEAFSFFNLIFKECSEVECRNLKRLWLMAPLFEGMPVVSFKQSICSVEDATFISWNHILDIDEGVFSSVGFEHLESLLNEVS